MGELRIRRNALIDVGCSHFAHIQQLRHPTFTFLVIIDSLVAHSAISTFNITNLINIRLAILGIRISSPLFVLLGF